MSKLYFRYGAMNCGKTTQLLQVAHNYEEKNKKVIIIKASIDSKGKDKIVSRLGVDRKVDILLEKNEKIEVMCHLFNGWSAVLFIKPLIAGVGGTGLILIILGGVMYSIGALLYGLGSTKKYMHSVFHFFCIFGTSFHYIAIYLYVL